MANVRGLAAPVRIVTERPRLVRRPPAGSVGPAGSAGPRGGSSQALSRLLVWTHPEWSRRFPWLAQGTTGRSPGMGSGDFRLFGAEARSEAADRWVELVLAEGFSGVFHSRQVHGNRILLHDQVPSGLSPGPDADGHASRQPGAFMAVTVADCVPVFLVDPHRRSTAVLHAGWRGIAAGILEEGIDLLTNQLGSRAEDLLIHLGPAICGTCYEVGPEVHVDLDQPDPGCPTPLDLRAVLTARALGRGLMHACLTRSSFCSLCGGSPFFSHRGGATQRQVGFMGVRTNPDPP